MMNYSPTDSNAIAQAFRDMMDGARTPQDLQRANAYANYMQAQRLPGQLGVEAQRAVIDNPHAQNMANPYAAALETVAQATPWGANSDRTAAALQRPSLQDAILNLVRLPELGGAPGRATDRQAWLGARQQERQQQYAEMKAKREQEALRAEQRASQERQYQRQLEEQKLAHQRNMELQGYRNQGTLDAAQARGDYSLQLQDARNQGTLSAIDARNQKPPRPVDPVAVANAYAKQIDSARKAHFAAINAGAIPPDTPFSFPSQQQWEAQTFAAPPGEQSQQGGQGIMRALLGLLGSGQGAPPVQTSSYAAPIGANTGSDMLQQQAENDLRGGQPFRGPTGPQTREQQRQQAKAPEMNLRGVNLAQYGVTPAEWQQIQQADPAEQQAFLDYLQAKR